MQLYRGQMTRRESAGMFSCLSFGVTDEQAVIAAVRLMAATLDVAPTSPLNKCVQDNKYLPSVSLAATEAARESGVITTV